MVCPYLSFTGSCEEAFRLYRRAFGGRLQHMVRYGDAPQDLEHPLDDIQKAMVMHAQLQLTDSGYLSGSDALWPVTQGSNLSIHVHLPTPERAFAAFAVLAEAGEVVGELKANSPPDGSSLTGAVRDAYGFLWILSAGA